MHGLEGEGHVLLGARIMGSLFGSAWEDECLRHSRYWSRRIGLPISRLCLADKLAFALTPPWLYLPMTRWTGELREYMTRSRQRQAGDNSFTSEEEMLVQSEVPEDWLRGLQSYTLPLGGAAPGSMLHSSSKRARLTNSRAGGRSRCTRK